MDSSPDEHPGRETFGELGYFSTQANGKFSLLSPYLCTLTSTLRPFLERDKRISWRRRGCEVQYIACIVYLHLYLEKSRPSPHPRCRKMAFLHAQIPNLSPRTMVGRRITDRSLSEYFKKKSGARRAVFPWASGITCCFFRDGIPLGNCTSFYIRIFHPQ